MLEDDSDQRETYYAYKNLYAVSSCNNPKHSNLQQASFERFWNRVNPGKAPWMLELWYRYAAIFIIALLLGFLTRYLVSDHKEKHVFARQIEYTSEKGSVSTIHLEDGSAIWLSSASKIVLKKSPTGEMNAQLNGEAYFDLVPDPARQLTVDLGIY